MKRVGNLLYALVGVVEQEDAATYYSLEDMLLNGETGNGFHYRGKIFWRKAKLVGIEGNTALTVEMLANEFYQFDVDVDMMFGH